MKSTIDTRGTPINSIEGAGVDLDQEAFLLRCRSEGSELSLLFQAPLLSKLLALVLVAAGHLQRDLGHDAQALVPDAINVARTGDSWLVQMVISETIPINFLLSAEDVSSMLRAFEQPNDPPTAVRAS